MQCPACGKTLSEIGAGSIKVHVCKDGCGGIWINHFQLDKIDKPDEYDGQVLVNLQNSSVASVDISQTLNCPQCADRIPMIRHFFSVKRDAVVDECPECGGYWIGMGQLLKIRQDFKTDADREKATDAYFTSMFGEAMAQDKRKDEAWERKAGEIFNIFKYICPSHYFKDKAWNRPF